MFSYTSKLQPEYRHELEQLLFFNSAQHTAQSAIVDSIEVYGEPFIDDDGDRLRVNVKKLDEVQTLFAFDGNRLVGLLIYSRISYERLVVIHIAVHENYSQGGKFARKMLALRISKQLRKCARSIKGVEFVRIMYGSNRTRDFTVKRQRIQRSRQISDPSETIQRM